MVRILTVLLACAAAQAATSNATVSITASESESGTGFTLSGTATMTVGSTTGNGAFTATIPLTQLQGGGSTVSGTFTMTLNNGTVAGTIVIPTALLEAQATSGSGSLTVSSASGSYSGDSGTFSTLAETASIGASGFSFSFTGNTSLTTGGTAAPPPPTVTAVLDAGSYTANIAEGSIFVVKGSNICASGLTELSYPLPTTSGGTSITFTPVSGGSGTSPYLIYTYNENGVSQLAAVLPSSLAAGTYNVTVTYSNQTSSAIQVQVVTSKPGILTQDSTGSGLAVAQNIVSATEYDLNRLTTGSVNGVTISPAKPGETIILYATGLGPVPGGDNIAESAYNFLTNGVNIQVLVGGTAITPLYAGRAPNFSGLDQINVTLPAGISTGCSVVLQIQEGNTTSAATTLSIAANGAADCVQPGFTNSQLSFLDNAGTIDSGSFVMSQSTETISGAGSLTNASVSGGFTQLTGFELPSVATGGSATASTNSTTIGSCTVTQVTYTGQSNNTPTAGGMTNYLDAGAVTLSGPSASNLNKTALTDTNGAYSFTIGSSGIGGLPGGASGTLAAGAYPLSAAGGTGVTSFNTSITSGGPLAITGGIPSTVVRSSGLPLGWTGGNSSDEVTITGFSGTTTGSGATAVTTATIFTCTTTAGTLGFTVPAQVLDLLPATPAAASGGSGYLSVASGPAPVPFSTTLTASPSTTVNATYSLTYSTIGFPTYQ